MVPSFLIDPTMFWYDFEGPGLPESRKIEKKIIFSKRFPRVKSDMCFNAFIPNYGHISGDTYGDTLGDTLCRAWRGDILRSHGTTVWIRNWI